jgi:hypothetical protein
MPGLQIKRGTRAQLNSAAGSAGLKVGELYLITDEDRLAVGKNTTTYTDLGKASDFATLAQGNLADTAVQPAAIASFETTDQLNTRDTNNRARENHTGTQSVSTISDFQSNVSSNSDVTANTLVRHEAVTVTDSDTVDLTLSGQNITAAVVDASITTAKLSSGVNSSLTKADNAVSNGGGVAEIVALTQAQYDAIVSPLGTTLYIITD